MRAVVVAATLDAVRLCSRLSLYSLDSKAAPASHSESLQFASSDPCVQQQRTIEMEASFRAGDVTLRPCSHDLFDKGDRRKRGAMGFLQLKRCGYTVRQKCEYAGFSPMADSTTAAEREESPCICNAFLSTSLKTGGTQGGEEHPSVLKTTSGMRPSCNSESQSVFSFISVGMQ